MIESTREISSLEETSPRETASTSAHRVPNTLIADYGREKKKIKWSYAFRKGTRVMVERSASPHSLYLSKVIHLWSRRLTMGLQMQLLSTVLISDQEYKITWNKINIGVMWWSVLVDGWLWSVFVIVLFALRIAVWLSLRKQAVWMRTGSEQHTCLLTYVAMCRVYIPRCLQDCNFLITLNNTSCCCLFFFFLLCCLFYVEQMVRAIQGFEEQN